MIRDCSYMHSPNSGTKLCHQPTTTVPTPGTWIASYWDYNIVQIVWKYSTLEDMRVYSTKCGDLHRGRRERFFVSPERFE
jgi:hypothetical protein